MGSGGEGFKSIFEKPIVSLGSKQVSDLIKNITDDPTISQETKTELLGQLTSEAKSLPGRSFGSGRGISPGKGTSFGTIGKVQKSFAAAKEGLGKFKGRQLKQAQIDILQDRPGRKQTILTKDSVI